jgi:hypothetical protein
LTISTEEVVDVVVNRNVAPLSDIKVVALAFLKLTFTFFDIKVVALAFLKLTLVNAQGGCSCIFKACPS